MRIWGDQQDRTGVGEPRPDRNIRSIGRWQAAKRPCRARDAAICEQAVDFRNGCGFVHGTVVYRTGAGWPAVSAFVSLERMTQVNRIPYWPLAPLALLAGVIPLVVVHAAWLISIHQGYIESCNPYLSGCTSISRAARHGSANLLFQGFMLPYSVLLAAYWVAAARWLDLNEPRTRSAAWIPPLALTAAVFLGLYTTFLGSEGHFYQLMRRYGVTVYFAFGFLAQLLFAGRLLSLARGGLSSVPRWVARAKITLCSVVLTLGLLNVAGAAMLDDNDALENAIEWHASLLTTVFYLLTWTIWRRDRFQLNAMRAP